MPSRAGLGSSSSGARGNSRPRGESAVVCAESCTGCRRQWFSRESVRSFRSGRGCNRRSVRPPTKRSASTLWSDFGRGRRRPKLAEIARHGMFAVAEQSELGLQTPHRSVIRAWMHPDEPDNAQKNALGIHVSCVPAEALAGRTLAMRQRDPTRPIFANFGRGVADTNWHGRGAWRGERAIIRAPREECILSFDIYPVANPAPPVRGRLEYVAKGVANLRGWADEATAVWAVIETTRIYHPTCATPDQIRSEVWLAIIAGAKGIVYFVHEFAPTFREDAVCGHLDAAETVARVNREIKNPAPVRSGPPRSLTTEVNGAEPIATMVRRQEGSLHLFAVSQSDRPGERP